MIIEITKFWKMLATIVVFWLFYAFFGFEITTVTLLSAILANFWSNSDFLI
jgi:hypothetical protein